MKIKTTITRSMLLLILLGLAVTSYAQFSSTLQGSVVDSSGAGIAGAQIELVNNATGNSRTTKADPHGYFDMVSLAPGSYRVTASAKGFSTSQIQLTLQTDQLMNLPITLKVASASQSVEVTIEAPVLDTADSRIESTITSEELDDAPLSGHSILDLTNLAPGVTGLGLVGTGTPGQTNDNFAAETTVDASANGRSFLGNMYVIDGLDVTSGVRPGVLNLAPNPDTIQETSIQVNTFSVEYGRNSSIVQVLTTKSGSDKYHGFISDYYTNNNLTAGTEFLHDYPEFHTNNMSGGLGGPIPFLRKVFFFTAWEPLRAKVNSGGSLQTFEDPAFTQWAANTFPDNIGPKLLAEYPVTNAGNVHVAKTAQDVFSSSCGKAATSNLPCDTPVFDNGAFNAATHRNALQYNVRIDKEFSRDRLYGNYISNTLNTGGPSLRANTPNAQRFTVRVFQVNETHTLSPNILNQAAFGFLRLYGDANIHGPLHTPAISVTGWTANIGVPANGSYYTQDRYTWRDSLTYLKRTHMFSFGYEGSFGTNVNHGEIGATRPTFSFTNMYNLAKDVVNQETGIYYDLVNGVPAGLLGNSRDVRGNNYGVYAQDVWKIVRNLTLTYGVRWDNYGNPHAGSNMILSDFNFGYGTTMIDRLINGYVQVQPNAYLNPPTAWSPRAGVAWDLTGQGKWVIKGGAGMYHDWYSLGNNQTVTNNPPMPVSQTFSQTTAIKPIFSVGTSDKYPFGFTLPSIPQTGLNKAGGIEGLQSSISGTDPNLKATNTYNYTIGLSRALGKSFVATAWYAGSHSNNLYSNYEGHTANVTYGYNINRRAGMLIDSNGATVRPNTSFGSITYVVNGPTQNYNALILSVAGRFLKHSTLRASYTRSKSMDDAYQYPNEPLFSAGGYKQYWGPSLWDVSNRLSLFAIVDLPQIKRNSLRMLRPIVNGWKISDTTILQSGNPFTVYTAAVFSPVCSSGTPTNRICPSGTTVIGNTGGDYNADGQAYDYPNIPGTGYKHPTSRSAYLKGIFGSNLTSTTVQQIFAPPALGGEGNEQPNRFRGPGYAASNLGLTRTFSLWKRASLWMNVSAFNVFNRPNLGSVGAATSTLSTFGIANTQRYPRYLQISGKVRF